MRTQYTANKPHDQKWYANPFSTQDSSDVRRLLLLDTEAQLCLQASGCFRTYNFSFQRPFVGIQCILTARRKPINCTRGVLVRSILGGCVYDTQRRRSLTNLPLVAHRRRVYLSGMADCGPCLHRFILKPRVCRGGFTNFICIITTAVRKSFLSLSPNRRVSYGFMGEIYPHLKHRLARPVSRYGYTPLE